MYASKKKIDIQTIKMAGDCALQSDKQSRLIRIYFIMIYTF